MCLECRTTFAAILISFLRSVASDQGRYPGDGEAREGMTAGIARVGLAVGLDKAAVWRRTVWRTHVLGREDTLFVRRATWWNLP
jgi:hypothetical protein